MTRAVTEPMPPTVPDDKPGASPWRLAALAAFVLCTSTLTGGCSVTDSESRAVDGDDEISLIDGMRDQGSYEDARARLNAAVTTIADRIVAAVPEQTWQFSADPNVQEAKAGGLTCDKLSGNVALRPLSDMVEFGRIFSAEEFATAQAVVAEEAAAFGATDESSLPDQGSRRDFDVQGNGYEFTLRQGGTAILTATGDCFLKQSVLDSPPGQLPPEPSLLPGDPPPTP